MKIDSYSYICLPNPSSCEGTARWKGVGLETLFAQKYYKSLWKKACWVSELKYVWSYPTPSLI